MVQHADVYAFGVLLVEMYNGERSFVGMRQPQIIHSIAVLKRHPQLPESAPAFLKVTSLFINLIGILHYSLAKAHINQHQRDHRTRN